MSNKLIKTSILVVSILTILLIIGQFVIMCMPYVNVWPVREAYEDPQQPPRDMSLMDICWLKTEDFLEDVTACRYKVGGDNFNPIYEYGQHYMSKNVFKINDFVIDVVLINLFAVVALIFLIISVKNQITNYHYGAANFVKIMAAVFTVVWGVFGISAFTNGWILSLGQIIKANYTSTTVPMLCLVTSIAAVVLGLYTLVMSYVTRTRYKVVKPNYDAQ